MRNLLYIVILLLAASCGYSGSRPQALEEARRLMADDPAAALQKLNGVDVSALPDSAVMARWALLYSEAMVANRLSAPTDTIIDIAVSYYGYHNLRDEYWKASRLKSLIKAGNNTNELATALYLQKEKEFLLYKERARRELLILAVLTVILLATGIIVWMRQRLKLQSVRNDVLMAEAAGLKCEIDAKSDDISRLETTLHGLLENRFALIDSLCQTYYESHGTKAERKAIADKLKSEIEAIRTDSFRDMEKAVNDCRNNILIKVKEALPGIKPEDYRLLVFIAGGLSTRTVSLLLGESVDVVYKRKSRLKARLRGAAAAFDNDFTSVF